MSNYLSQFSDCFFVFLPLRHGIYTFSLPPTAVRSVYAVDPFFAGRKFEGQVRRLNFLSRQPRWRCQRSHIGGDHPNLQRKKLKKIAGAKRKTAEYITLHRCTCE